MRWLVTGLIGVVVGVLILLLLLLGRRHDYELARGQVG